VSASELLQYTVEGPGSMSARASVEGVLEFRLKI